MNLRLKPYCLSAIFGTTSPYLWLGLPWSSAVPQPALGRARLGLVDSRTVSTVAASNMIDGHCAAVSLVSVTELVYYVLNNIST